MALEIRQPRPEDLQRIAKLFSSVAQDGESFFHPHPMTDEWAGKICNYRGKDLYYAVFDGEQALAYGMLRGWDEGYEIPSLGIAVSSEMRGAKLGEMFMHFLHSAARRNGSHTVRLKVYAENAAAMSLYRKLGYVFSEESESGQFVGKIEF